MISALAHTSYLDLKHFQRPRSHRLELFMIASGLLHVVAFIVFAFMPTPQITKPKPPTVKVSFVQEPQVAAKPAPTIIDAPIPEKIEKPSTLDFVSNADSRMHSDQGKKKSDDYVNRKTVIPKVGVPEPLAMATPPMPRPSPPTPKPQQTKPTETPPILERGLLEPEPKRPMQPKFEIKTRPAQPAPDQPASSASRQGNPSATPYDGFDPAKYAALDTNNPDADEGSDEKPISLDTSESKYVSYFTRIKQQIERVWVYPLDAARKGISGELTLRFQISRDGTLLSLTVVRDSGSEVLDLAAVKAVKNAAPYYPIPLNISRDKISILATFIYSPTYGAR